MLFARKSFYCCFQYFPLIFVFAIITYEYVIFLAYFLISWFSTNPATATIVTIEFHLFLILLIISYVKTCFSSPGYPPENINDFFANLQEIREKTIEYKKKKENDKRIEYEKRKKNIENKENNKEKLESYQAINIGRDSNSDLAGVLGDELTDITFCFKCDRIKIPRAHHCKTCNKCVLRMDHHCPWTGNCVGLNNHKYFILFLFYADLCLLNIFTCMGQNVYSVLFSKNKEDFSTIINSLLCVVIAVTFFISLMFLCFYNFYSICKNFTTIESNYERIINENPFNRGSIRKNIEEVFGENICYWFLPTQPKFRENYQNFEQPSAISFYQGNK